VGLDVSEVEYAANAACIETFGERDVLSILSPAG
jgi:hypothetical protein